MRRIGFNKPYATPGPTKLRRGTVIVLASSSMVVVFGFAAFSIDVGYISLTKTQLQNAADAAAIGACQELVDGLGHNPTKTPGEAETDARAAAVAVAAANRAGERQSIHCNGNRDVRLGQYVWNGSGYDKNWGVSPYNLIEVTLRRDQAIGAPDGPLPLFFAPVIGHRTATLVESATSAMIPGSGIRVRAGSNQKAGVLPFALDEPTWNNLINNNIGEQDLFTHNWEDQALASGGDGVQEINLYPNGAVSTLPGNRGTVDIGGANNSTADLSRQITDGLNETDLSYFGGELDPSYENPLVLQGDTGISAGMKDELDLIKGEPKLIPIFTEASGNGNNSQFTIVKFVPVTVVAVKLSGNPKYVMVQPTKYVGTDVIPGTDTTITADSYFTPVVLVP